MIETKINFTFTPNTILNVVTNFSYAKKKTIYVNQIRKAGHSIVEITHVNFTYFRSNIIANKDMFSAFDILVINGDKLGNLKCKLYLHFLEHVLKNQMIVVFTRYKLKNLNLLKLTAISTYPFSGFFVPLISSIKSEIINYLAFMKNKKIEINKLLDEYDQYVIEEKKKKQIQKTPKVIVKKNTTPIKKYSVELIFLFLFTSLATLSATFALSNTQNNLYISTIKSSTSEVQRKGKAPFILSSLSLSFDYNANYSLLDASIIDNSDFVPFLSFENEFNLDVSNVGVNPVIFHSSEEKYDSLNNYGINLFTEQGLDIVPANHSRAVIPEKLLNIIFDGNYTDYSEYLGMTFKMRYSYQLFDFVVDNIVIDETSQQFELFYSNHLFLFEKPIGLSNSVTHFSSIINNDTKSVESFVSVIENLYSDLEFLDYSYINMEGAIVSTDFILNTVYLYRGESQTNYTIEIVFIMVMLLIFYFSLKITLKLHALYKGNMLELVLITSVTFLGVLAVYLGIVITLLASGFAVTAFSLLNTFGIIASSIIVLIYALVLWHTQIIFYLTKKKPNF